MQVRTTIELSDREEAFVLNMARGQKPTVAVANAGWSTASARNLLRKGHIQAAVKQIAANLAAVCNRINAMNAGAE